jgi:hypothetical protein
MATVWATRVEISVPYVWLLDDSGLHESMGVDEKWGTPLEQSIDAVHGYGADPDTHSH